MAWFAWYPGDFAGDPLVRLMTLPARAAYRELLDLSWEVGPLKDPRAALTGLGYDAALWTAIAPCWRETDAGWVQERLERERDAALAQRGRARKANEKRWGRSDPNGDPNGVDLHIPTGSSPPPPPPPQKKKTQKKKRASARPTSDGDAAVAQGRLEYPDLMRHPGFAEGLRELATLRVEQHRDPFTQRGLRAALGKLALHPEIAAAVVERCIAGSGGKCWKGVEHGLKAIRRESNAGGGAARSRLDAIYGGDEDPPATPRTVRPE